MILLVQIITGLIFFAVVGQFFKDFLFNKENGVRITARITSVQLKNYRFGTTANTPCVSYVVDGQPYWDIPLTSWDAKNGGPQVGDYVDIYYNENRPEELVSHMSLGSMLVILAIVGSIFAFCLFAPAYQS